MRFLALVTDAFGGRGGIAQFNRDLIDVLCNHPDTLEVTVLPRVIADKGYRLPARLVYEIGASQGKAAYLYHFGKVLAQRLPLGAVVCGHLHLLPLAAIAARQSQAPLILIIHGIEAWQPPRTPGLSLSLRAIDQFVSVSNLTKQRFLTWAALKGDQGRVIPNCVDASRFSPGHKPEYLLRRYGLTGRGQILLTVARLSTPDRYKGIDEVLEVLPSSTVVESNVGP